MHAHESDIEDIESGETFYIIKTKTPTICLCFRLCRKQVSCDMTYFQRNRKWNQLHQFLLTPGGRKALIAAIATDETLLAETMHVFAINLASLSFKQMRLI